MTHAATSVVSSGNHAQLGGLREAEATDRVDEHDRPLPLGGEHPGQRLEPGTHPVCHTPPSGATNQPKP